jgi:hypothetical protein
MVDAAAIAPVRTLSPSWHVLLAWALGPGGYLALAAAHGLGWLPLEFPALVGTAMVLLYLHVASAFATAVLLWDRAVRRTAEFWLLGLYWLLVAAFLVATWRVGGERREVTDGLALAALAAAGALPLCWLLRRVLGQPAASRRPC